MILMSGPCVIEGYEALSAVAEALKPLNENPNIDFYFKSSFDKANRTSLESYRGPGLEEGMEILGEIKKKIWLQNHYRYTRKPPSPSYR